MSAAVSQTIPEFIDDVALEALTGVKRVTWQAYRYRGIGPAYYKIGRRVVYKWSEVSAWINAQKVGA